jgi:hypothetical protein
MPGRCLTGSKPFKTRIELSEYSAGELVEVEGDFVAISLDCRRLQMFAVQIISIPKSVVPAQARIHGGVTT